MLANPFTPDDASPLLQSVITPIGRRGSGLRLPRQPRYLATIKEVNEPAKTQHRWVRPSLALFVVAILGVEIAFLIPHLHGTGRALGHLHWRWLALSVIAEVSSMMYFARLQRRMLRAGGVRVPLRRAAATALAANALSVTLPAGPVLSTSYMYRRMRDWGASAPLATWGMFASGGLSTVALAVIGILGSGLASGHRPDVFLVLAEVVLALAIIVSLRRLVHHPERIMHIGEYSLTQANRVLHRPAERGQERLHDLVEEITLIRPRTSDWLFGLNFAILNWVADLVCLIAACHAVGSHGPSLAVSFVAYAAGMAASSLPLLPGGLGVVDGTLVLALTRGGLPASIATAGVLVYRLISFIFVAAIGWVAWAAIRRGDRRRSAAAGEIPAAPA
jgi:uncharacterized protein (TIRG00374 family)